jgi:hypothetical protein
MRVLLACVFLVAHTFAQRLVWEEDFLASSLSPTWSVSHNFTHGNTEKQLYVRQAVTLRDGHLVLRAFAANSTSPSGKPYYIEAGWIDTARVSANGHGPNANGFSHFHGRWDVRAKLPVGLYWPAIWLMPDANICWPTGGEIDIMEPEIWATGAKPPFSIDGTYHYADSCGVDIYGGKHGNYGQGTDFSADFHVYSIEWTATSLAFLVDNHTYFTQTDGSTNNHLPKTPMYLILNLAVAPFQSPPNLPQEFLVDWIKVYDN